jgi:hypothetical protein
MTRLVAYPSKATITEVTTAPIEKLSVDSPQQPG